MSVNAVTELRQHLTFTLEKELFAVNISKIREVLDYTTITKVPSTPDFLRGVINLRGSVIPVVDMRLKFNMPKTKRTVNTSIIITEITLDEGPTVIGALVDSVQEVLDLDEDQVEPPPRFGTHLKTEFIKGMGMRGDRFIMILDIEKVFSIEELALVQSVDGKEHSEQMTEQLETAV